MDDCNICQCAQVPGGEVMSLCTKKMCMTPPPPPESEEEDDDDEDDKSDEDEDDDGIPPIEGRTGRLDLCVDREIGR